MLETFRDRVGTPELVPKNVICNADNTDIVTTSEYESQYAA
jgi:hypothetical protein